MARQGQQLEDFISIMREDLQDLVLRERAREELYLSRERAQARERILDKRWMIGTVIAAAGLVIAALALFLNGAA